MLLLGLDAAAQFKDFGYAFARRSEGGAVLEDTGLLRTEASLADALAPRIAAAQRCLIAIDAPLGWPESLARSLVHHEAGGQMTVPANALFRRATDDHIHERLGRRPLDVGADRIARATWRALEVVATLRRLTRLPIPLAWAPKDIRRSALIEVYPSATLAAHGAPSSGYKSAAQRSRRQQIAEIVGGRLGGLEQHVDGPEHVFDAALCALAALDFIDGLCVPPDALPRAQREGWIWAAREKRA